MTEKATGSRARNRIVRTSAFLSTVSIFSAAS